VLNLTNQSIQHCYYQEKSKKFIQGIRPREKECLIKIYQNDFPDAAVFGGNLLDVETPVSDKTETYCRLALLLFYPFHTLEELVNQRACGDPSMQLFFHGMENRKQHYGRANSPSRRGIQDCLLDTRTEARTCYWTPGTVKAQREALW
jgi:hypothetical protein